MLRGPGCQACGSGRRPTCWPWTSCEATAAAASLSSSRLLFILLPPLCQIAFRSALQCHELSFSPCELAAALPALCPTPCHSSRGAHWLPAERAFVFSRATSRSPRMVTQGGQRLRLFTDPMLRIAWSPWWALEVLVEAGKGG